MKPSERELQHVRGRLVSTIFQEPMNALNRPDGSVSRWSRSSAVTSVLDNMAATRKAVGLLVRHADQRAGTDHAGLSVRTFRRHAASVC